MSNPNDNPYNATPSNGSSPYGNNQPPAGPNPPQQPYEQAPYGNSPYANSPYDNSPYQNQGGFGVETEEGKKNAKIGLITGIIGIFFFSLILGLVSLHYGKKANATGGNGKPAIILGTIDLVIAVISGIAILMSRH
jgi:hypothetical protein